MGVSIASAQPDIPLRTLVDNAPVMTWVVGPDQQFTFFNKGWLAFTGRTLDHKQAPTTDWLLSVHPDDHARYLETYTRAFATQQEFEVEYRLRRHDGVYRWVWDRAVPHVAPDGTFLGFAGGCIDITERRELAAALQRSEARFHAAQELSLDGFVLLESVRDAAGQLIDFTFAYVNPSAAAMLGRPVGAFAGQRLLDLYPGVRKQSDLFARWVQVVETGAPHDIETWYAADGIQGWFRNMAVKLDDGLAITFHEITDRKWLEGALLVGEAAVAQQLAELQAIYATAPVGLAVLDTNLRYVRINERLAAMNGQPAAAHLSRTVYEMIPDLAEEVARILRQAMAQGKPLLDHEIRSRPSPTTGRVRTWLQSCYPLRDSSGQVVGLNVVVQEITERKRAEEALQRLVACTLTSGPDFFRALACALTEALGVRYAFVAELLPDGDGLGATAARTIALWADGKQGATMTYDLAGTPCADVVKQQTCFYPQEVQGLFPDDKLLAEMEVASYLGAPLRAADGTTLGLLVVMHDQPIDETLQPLALLQIFAGHAAAELERMRNEQALRASEARFRRTFECNMAPMGIWTATGGITEANDALLDLIGYSRQELTSGAINWRALTPPEFLPLDEQALVEIRGKGVCTPFAKEYIHKDGRRIPILIGGGSFSANAESGIFFVIDLTAQQQAKAALHAGEERYRNIVHTANEGIWLIDRAAQTLFVNDRMAEMLGYAPAEIVGRPVMAFTFPEDAAVARTHIARNWQGHTEQFDFRFRRKDGRKVLVLAGTSPSRDAQGAIVGALGMFMDVTERQYAVAALRKSEEQLRIITDSVPGLIGYVDREERYQFVNAAYEQWFGVSRTQIVGRTIRELLTPTIYTEVQPYVQRVLAGEQVTFERQLAYVDGRKTILATYTPHRVGLPGTPGESAGPVVGFYVLVMDITQRKAAEDRLRLAEGQLRQLNEQLEQRIAERTRELERSNRDLDQFAYAASHDLKAPLRAIQQLALWIEEDAGAVLPAAAQQRLHTLRGRAQRLEKLLTDLLAYARAGREQHVPQTVQTQALVQDVVEMLAPPPTLTITQSALPTLRTVRVPLETVLRNLISNAIKHHHRPAGHIRITAQAQGDFIEFAVADDGPGIPAQFHTRIFDLFQTLQPRDQVEGSGMGLALVKKLVERYGGAIRVESAAGQGATFRFTWPHRIDYPLG